MVYKGKCLADSGTQVGAQQLSTDSDSGKLSFILRDVIISLNPEHPSGSNYIANVHDMAAKSPPILKIVCE